MKPWREVVVPHPDVLEGTFQQSEFAADITAVHTGQATQEYQDAAAFFIHSPAFAVSAPSGGIRVVADYPDREALMSGWMLGERTIAGRAAVIEASIGKGRVVLLGFRTQHRGQPHGTFKLLFNSILLAASET